MWYSIFFSPQGEVASEVVAFVLQSLALEHASTRQSAWSIPNVLSAETCDLATCAALVMFLNNVVIWLGRCGTADSPLYAPLAELALQAR